MLCVALLSVLTCLRKALPRQADVWRGQLDHLVESPGPPFSHSCCAICLADLDRRDGVCRTQCEHDFHRECLEEWVQSTTFVSRDTGEQWATCPLCREHLGV